MNITRTATAALLVGLLLGAAPLLQADDKTGAAADQHHKHWDKFDGLKKRLDLSDDQVSQWKDEEKREQDSGKLLRDKLKADLAHLAVLVDEKAAEADLKEALSGLEADHKALQDQQEKKKEALKAILSPLQQAKLVVMMTDHKGGRGMHGGWGGPKGPMDGRGGPDDLGPDRD